MRTGAETKSIISNGLVQLRRLSPNDRAISGIDAAKMSSAQPLISKRGAFEVPLLSKDNCAYCGFELILAKA